MQVVKGDENGYPVPGGWTAGRQPVTVKKKKRTVRKLKLWPRNSQTEWSQPRQWKRLGDEDSDLECGVVYKQVLINAKLQTVKRGQKQN